MHFLTLLSTDPPWVALLLVADVLHFIYITIFHFWFKVVCIFAWFILLLYTESTVVWYGYDDGEDDVRGFCVVQHLD